MRRGREPWQPYNLHRLVYHSTLGLRVIKMNKKGEGTLACSSVRSGFSSGITYTYRESLGFRVWRSAEGSVAVRFSGGADRYSPQFKNKYFAEIWSGLDEGSDSRLIVI